MMWALRSSSSSTCFIRGIAIRLQTASPPAQSLVLARPRCAVRPLSSKAAAAAADGKEYQTGTVKFYLRDKAYGFIVPDDGSPSDEIWVHRTSLDTPHSAEEFPTRPYLQRHERVKFRVEQAAAGESNKAVDVLFENGRQVPLFRKNYHKSVLRAEMLRFGEAVYDILLEENLSDEDRMERIKRAGKAAEGNISLAADRQEQFGPEP